MRWGAPLQLARFVKRPNRFVVHARLEADGREVVAHLADPGRLKELLLPGARMGLRPEAPSPTRTTRWTAMLVEAPESDGALESDAAPEADGAAESETGRWVSVNTTMPNRLVREALAAGALEEFDGWRLVRHEVAYGDSRLDFLLADEAGRSLYVEAKSVTLVEEGVALFPDAVTARGARHLEELIRAVEEGHQAAVLFVLQRPDASRIVAAESIDPVFSNTLGRAEAAGVRVLGRRCRVTWEGMEMGGPVPASSGAWPRGHAR